MSNPRYLTAAEIVDKVELAAQLRQEDLDAEREGSDLGGYQDPAMERY